MACSQGLPIDFYQHLLAPDALHVTLRNSCFWPNAGDCFNDALFFMSTLVVFAVTAANMRMSFSAYNSAHRYPWQRPAAPVVRVARRMGAKDSAGWMLSMQSKMASNDLPIITTARPRSTPVCLTTLVLLKCAKHQQLCGTDFQRVEMILVQVGRIESFYWTLEVGKKRSHTD